ncbi:MAG: hypothetical protein AAFX04_06550 [Pseudomonadota bacterium]
MSGNATTRFEETSEKIRQTVTEHPLASLTGAVLIGIAIGASLPNNRREQSLIGDAGRKVRQGAENAIHAAQEAGRAGLENAGLSVDEAKLHFRDLVRRAGEATHSARDAARERMGR